MQIRSTQDFADAIVALGMTKSGLARLMKEFSDDRDRENIRRTILRMCAGEQRISGDMRVLLGLMERQAASLPRADDADDDTAPATECTSPSN